MIFLTLCLTNFYPACPACPVAPEDGTRGCSTGVKHAEGILRSRVSLGPFHWNPWSFHLFGCTFITRPV